jgi:uncharacterized protein YjiS (DUF1127 family)
LLILRHGDAAMVASQSLASPFRQSLRHPPAFAQLSDAVARRRLRAELRRLLRTGDYLLADIGMSVDEARAEIAKPLWRR